MLTIQFEPRKIKVTRHSLKKSGKIPAVFYGPKEVSTPITLKEIAFRKIWNEAGESSIIVLKHGVLEHEALIQDVDIHPVNGFPLHADFYVIEKGKKLEVEIPLEFVGVAPAVKDLGGILVKVLHDLTIEALPKDLPREIKVDISSLVTIESRILAKDLKLSEGVVLKISPEDVVAAISVAKEEVEEPTKGLEDIEVVGLKSKEETPEGGADGAETPASDKKASEKKISEKKAPDKKAPEKK